MSAYNSNNSTPGPTPVLRGYVLASNPVRDGEHLWIIRLILPPGAELPHWTRLGLTTMYVESGVLQFTGVTGNADLTRGIHPVERSRTRTGEFTRMKAGDSVTVNRGIQHSLFNPVDDPTLILITTLAPQDVIPFDGLHTAEGYPIIIER